MDQEQELTIISEQTKAAAWGMAAFKSVEASPDLAAKVSDPAVFEAKPRDCSFNDWVAWQIVQETVIWRQEHQDPYLTHACRALGLDYRKTWYMEQRAFVKRMLAITIASSLQTASTYFSQRLLDVGVTMVKRATSPSDPQGVAAARFVRDFTKDTLKRLEEEATEDEGGINISRAARTMAGFGRVEVEETVTTRRRKVTVEADENNVDVIDQ